MLEATSTSSHEDFRVDVLRINPDYFLFELKCMEQKKSGNKKIDQIAAENNLLAAVNAGMFKLEGNFQTSTGYEKRFIPESSYFNPSYKNVCVFAGRDTSKKSAGIIDLSCQNWTDVKNNYTSCSQGIRMVNCASRAIWHASEKKWRVVLLGEDMNGTILFIFCRSPYKVLDCTNMLLQSELKLTRLMYLEGRPEASFYMNHPKKQYEKWEAMKQASMKIIQILCIGKFRI